MTPEQIPDLANLLHARVRSTRYRQLYRIKPMIGDARAGEFFFKNAGHCYGGRDGKIWSEEFIEAIDYKTGKIPMEA